MITVSQKFKDYAANPDRLVEFKCLIDGVEYDKTKIIDIDIEDAIISGEDFELGSVVSSKLGLTIRTSDAIANNAEMKPYVRFIVGGDTTEWIQQGTMYVDSRFKNANVYKFSSYDKLITSQKPYETDLLFPNTQAQVLIELAYNLGIEVDEATTTMINPAYMVPTKPDSKQYTYRDIIKFIAISHGCCARMSNTGKLQFVSFVSRTSVKSITQSESWSAKELNPFKEIKKIAFNLDSDLEPIILGEGDESVTLKVYNPWVTEEMANTIFTAIYDISYMPLSFGWRCEPWIQTGDFVTVQTRSATFNSIILRLRKKYKGGLSATVESPCSTASQSEFGFGGKIGTQIAQMGQRIGLFAHATNTSKKTVKQTAVQVALMPLTTASETDIEFVVTLNGVASVDSILRVSFRIAGSDVGRIMRIPVKAGLVGNFISFSTLRAKVPKISDWLFCRMVVDAGNFVIEKNECEFYIYGGNIVSGDVKPILEFEDVIEYVEGLSDGLIVTFPENISIIVSDSIGTISGLSDNLGGVNIV